MEQILSYSSSILTANQTPTVYLHHHSISSINKSVGSLNLVSTPTQLWSFSKLTTTSKQHNKLSVKCRQSEYFEQPSRFSSRPANDSSNSPPSAAGLPPRVFVGHYIYKGKAALAVEPRPPEFVPLDSGAYKISKEGFIFLQFAPAAGVRQYDWSRKQVFSLSVPEIGSLISLGSKESCEFFHDPNKGKSEEGKVRKVLKVEPLPHGSGHFFNLSVQNKLLNMDESIYIPISKAEFAVLVTAFKFILPYLLGWNAVADSIRPDDSGRVNNTNPSIGVDYEWSR